MGRNQILLPACGMYLRMEKYRLSFDNDRVRIWAVLQGWDRSLECLICRDLSVQKFCL